MDFSPRNLYLPGGKIIVPGGGMGVDAGISPGPSGGGGGGGGGSNADMIYDVQTIIDDAGAQAGDGDDLFATGKWFQAGGVWRSTGVETTPDLVGQVTTLGTVTMRQTAGPNSTPYLQFLRISGNNPFLYCTGTTPKALFYNDEFTHFFVVARDSADTGTGVRGIAGASNVASREGWALNFNGVGKQFQIQHSDGVSTTVSSAGVYVENAFDIVSIAYSGTAMRMCVNTYHATPDLNLTVGFNKTTASRADPLGFQMGNDGENTKRAFLRLAEARFYRSYLGATEHDAEMDSLAAKFGLTVA